MWRCWCYGWVLPFLARQYCWYGFIVHTKRRARHWMLKNKIKKSNHSPTELPWHGKTVPRGASFTSSRLKYFLGKIIIGGTQGPAELMQRVTAAKDPPHPLVDTISPTFFPLQFNNILDYRLSWETCWTPNENQLIKINYFYICLKFWKKV